MRDREIPGRGPILSRFCRDPGLSRDKPLNSSSDGPLNDHTYHTTNIRPSERQEAAPQGHRAGFMWNRSTLGLGVAATAATTRGWWWHLAL